MGTPSGARTVVPDHRSHRRHRALGTDSPGRLHLQKAVPTNRVPSFLTHEPKFPIHSVLLRHRDLTRDIIRVLSLEAY